MRKLADCWLWVRCKIILLAAAAGNDPVPLVTRQPRTKRPSPVTRTMSGDFLQLTIGGARRSGQSWVRDARWQPGGLHWLYLWLSLGWILLSIFRPCVQFSIHCTPTSVYSLVDQICEDRANYSRYIHCTGDWRGQAGLNILITLMVSLLGCLARLTPSHWTRMKLSHRRDKTASLPSPGWRLGWSPARPGWRTW